MFGMTFQSSISTQREKIEKQFKETVQKHSQECLLRDRLIPSIIEIWTLCI